MRTLAALLSAAVVMSVAPAQADPIQSPGCDNTHPWYGSGTIHTNKPSSLKLTARFVADPAPDNRCEAKEGGLRWRITINDHLVNNFILYAGDSSVWRYEFRPHQGRKVVKFIQVIPGHPNADGSWEPTEHLVIERYVIKTGRRVIVSTDGSIPISIPGVPSPEEPPAWQ